MGIDAQMFIKTREKVTEKQVRQKAYLLAGAFGKQCFYIGVNWCGERRAALEIIETYQQDGPPVAPEDGETLIECHLRTRYYGEGYARGDYNFIKGVAEWLEHHFPDCEVYYGGDSSGVIAECFDKERRAELWLHFCGDVNSYGRHFDKQLVLCSFCEMPMVIGTWSPSGS